MYSRILVPLDGSMRAEGILPHVQSLARAMGSRMIFLQVIDPADEIVGAHLTAFDITPALLETHVRQATEYINGLCGEFEKLGFDVSGRVERGPIVNTIIQAAEREAVDLIAIASHGRTGLARVFYGSVAAGVLHKTDRPLLLIRAGADE